MRLKLSLAGAALALLALPVRAQEPPAPDPIGALLEQPQEAPADPNDPEAEAPGAAPPQQQQPAYAVPPSTPGFARPPRPQLTEPVNVDETGKSPDYPPNPVDLGYEARLRASSASAQGLQGPLDGAWTLRDVGGRELYALLLVDNAQGLEGAWRDPRRRGATESSGFLNAVQRTGAGITITFYPAPGAGLATVTLAPAADGSWSGELDERGDRQAVTLRRN